MDDYFSINFFEMLFNLISSFLLLYLKFYFSNGMISFHNKQQHLHQHWPGLGRSQMCYLAYASGLLLRCLGESDAQRWLTGIVECQPKLHMMQELHEHQSFLVGSPQKHMEYKNESFCGEVAALATRRGVLTHMHQLPWASLSRYRALSHMGAT